MEERPAAAEDVKALLDRVMKTLVEQSEALKGLATLEETRARQIGAQQRMIVALAAIGVEQARDRLAFTDELRRLALDPHKDADDPAGPERELIELYLAKVEAYAVRLGRRD